MFFGLFDFGGGWSTTAPERPKGYKYKGRFYEHQPKPRKIQPTREQLKHESTVEGTRLTEARFCAAILNTLSTDHVAKVLKEYNKIKDGGHDPRKPQAVTDAEE